MLIAGFASSLAAERDDTVRINHATVAARGRQSAPLTLKAFGRYAITGTSAQSRDGTTGAGRLIVGETGKQDGRLDLFLDRGEHNILAHASSKSNGQAKLSAHAFRELHDRPPFLIEQRLERATMGDFERRSYCLEIKEKRTVALEAAGRHPGRPKALARWTWLVNASQHVVLCQARVDRPLQIARIDGNIRR